MISGQTGGRRTTPPRSGRGCGAGASRTCGSGRRGVSEPAAAGNRSERNSAPHRRAPVRTLSPHVAEQAPAAQAAAQPAPQPAAPQTCPCRKPLTPVSGMPSIRRPPLSEMAFHFDGSSHGGSRWMLPFIAQPQAEHGFCVLPCGHRACRHAVCLDITKNTDEFAVPAAAQGRNQSPGARTDEAWGNLAPEPLFLQPVLATVFGFPDRAVGGSAAVCSTRLIMAMNTGMKSTGYPLGPVSGPAAPRVMSIRLMPPSGRPAGMRQ